MKTFENAKLYIIMRTDLDSLTPGKAMAQAAHAANAAETAIMTHGGKTIKAAWKSWKGDRGYGTTIVLDGLTEDVIIDGLETFTERTTGFDYVTGDIVDPTYPVKDGSVTHEIKLHTCSWIFVDSTISTHDLWSLFKKEYK